MLGLTKESKLKEKRDEAAKFELKYLEEREVSRELDEKHASALEHGEFSGLKNKRNTIEVLNEPQVAWKRTYNYILELVIPCGETVVHPRHHSKKRVSRAYVRQFYKEDGRTKAFRKRDRSLHERDFFYDEGTFVEPEEGLNTDMETVCGSGIHVFASKWRAINYK